MNSIERSRQTLWLVHTPDEAGAFGPAIPTLGHPTSASDLYRVAAIHTTGHEGWNSCYTDFTVPAALGRLIDGPINSARDLSAAEVALQALFWHERVDVLVPAFKARNGNLITYARQRDSRNDVAFSLFQDALAYDQFNATEFVDVANGRVTASTLHGSHLVGSTLESATLDYLARSPIQAGALAALPVHMGVPAYFADPSIEPFLKRRGFFGEFYDAMAKEWHEAVSAVPDVSEVVHVPPLLAVVLDRAASRSEMPAAIRELRSELAPVRTELLNFAAMVHGARRQAEIESACKDIRRAFAATVKASRLGPAPFLLPLLKFYKAARSPLDPLIKALGPDPHPTDPRILVERTVTTRTFTELLKVDSMHSLLTSMLTAGEVRALERDAATSSHGP